MKLSFDQSDRSGQVLSAISEHEITLPKLRTLCLSLVTCSNNALAGFIGIFKDTLKELTLTYMILDSGSWKDLITVFLNELSLHKIMLCWLDENLFGVSFRPIHLERPIIDEYWWFELMMSSTDEELEFFSDFQYIIRERSNTILKLEDGNGEDICEWLAKLPDGYELVGTPAGRSVTIY